MAREYPLTDGVLQGLARIMGDTSDGLTGFEIGRYLQMFGIADCSPGITKWQRLFNAFAEYQNTTHCCNAILNFCKNYFQPELFVNSNKFLFEQQRTDANRLLAFAGYEISPRGGIIKTSKISTISEAEERANSLRHELKARNTHNEIFRFCYPELLADDYFHAVEESLKGLYERIIRDILVEILGVMLYLSFEYVSWTNMYLGGSYISPIEVLEQELTLITIRTIFHCRRLRSHAHNCRKYQDVWRIYVLSVQLFRFTKRLL